MKLWNITYLVLINIYYFNQKLNNFLKSSHLQMCKRKKRGHISYNQKRDKSKKCTSFVTLVSNIVFVKLL